ncbi:MAG TPA: pantoate--beta-alanine ligase [Acidimicrobiia bacterium]
MSPSEVITTVEAMREACDDARRRGATVGVVPTMGYLHEGHRSLMRAARAACDYVVVTIFVNPLQFGPNEDLDRYPRDLDGDLAACAEEGIDAAFVPTVAQLYPDYPPRTTVHVAGLTEVLCGASRPTHFDGVTTIVAKLLSIAGPCRAYFGRKDAQQLAVIRRMAADLDLPATIVGCPLVREPDGLARSSRNAYLDARHRAAAPRIFAALRDGVAAVESGERGARRIETLARDTIDAVPELEIDYAEVRAADSLDAIDQIAGPVLLAVAVFCGASRLIDNVPITVTEGNVTADLGTGWNGPAA